MATREKVLHGIVPSFCTTHNVFSSWTEIMIPSKTLKRASAGSEDFLCFVLEMSHADDSVISATPSVKNSPGGDAEMLMLANFVLLEPATSTVLVHT